MKKGINAWAYPSNFCIEKILEVSSELGYDGVELNLDEKTLEFQKNERKSVADKAVSLGIKLPSLCSGLFWKFNLASSDRTIRKKGLEILKKGCIFAADIDASVFLVVPAVATLEVPYQKMWTLSNRSILEAAPIAEDYGIILGIENVWNRFLYSPIEFKQFIEEIDHPNVKAYFDVGNIHFLGFPQQWIRYLSDLIVCIHLKDFCNETIQFKPLLEGNISWPEVMKNLREIGYDGFLNVEVPSYLDNPLKAAKDSIKALDILFNMK
ncbi:MAG: sugar phosphate isomerase/epimerase family protein [Candidatus Heimdallarchaeaceae archaeon]|jgi:hexulose-6-phosphate isomerase